MRRAWGWFLAAAAAGVVVLYVPGGAGPVAAVSCAFSLAVCVALAVGIRVHRPPEAAPWRVLLAGFVVYALANLVFYAALAGLTAPLPYPSIADALYLVGYGTILVALAMFVRAGTRGRSPLELLDAAIAALGLFAVTWLLVLEPLVARGFKDPLVATVSLAYPVIDVGLLGLAIGLLISWRSPGAAGLLLVGALFAQGLADGVYQVQLLEGTFHASSPAYGLWLASWGLLGAAGLHPDMRTLGPRAATARDPRRRLLLVAAAALLPPIVITAAPDQARVLAPVSAALLVLAFARIGALTQDVRRHEELARRLAEAEERLRIVVENVPAVIYMESRGRVLYVGPQIRDLLGIEPYRGPRTPWADRIHPEDRAVVLGEASRTDETGERWLMEYRMVRTDGRVVWVHDEAVAVRTEEGADPVWLGVMTDVTARRETEAALEAAEQRYRSLVETMPAVTYVDRLDPDAPDGVTTEYVSPQVEALIGYPADRIVGDPSLWMSLIHPEDRDRVRDAEAHHYRTGEPLHQEFRLIARDGREVWVRDHAVVVREGDRLLSQGVLLDVTEHKLLEEALRAQDAAERANRAKSEFLSRMSHELRTPLNAILGFGQLLASSPLSEDDLDSARRIVAAGNHLLELVDDVLEIARLESGRTMLSIEPVSVLDVATSALDLSRPAAAERGVQLGPPEGPAHAHVLADRTALLRVLAILLANAVAYNRERGSAAVSWRALGEIVDIEVSDTGVGIAAEKMDRLFSPFDRLDVERSTGDRGTGLGLALARRLVAAMGGAIRAESEPGRGSRFHVELVSAEPPGAEEVPGEERRGARRTVLYIEDNAANIRLIERVIAKRPGVQVLAAQRGELGLELAAEHRPDLVLLDLNLPDLPGQEVMARLLSEPRTAEIPIVLLSADTTRSKAERLVAAGAREYLTKPLDVRRFLEVLDGVFGRAGEGSR